jgi:hypothetical protein
MTNETTIAKAVSKSRGWRRYRELRQQDEADKKAIMCGLIDGLGRPASMADRLAAEQIASLTVWVERRGRFEAAAEVRDQITRTPDAVTKSAGFEGQRRTIGALPFEGKGHTFESCRVRQ